MDPNEPLSTFSNEYDLTLVETNIYKLWNQITSKPTSKDTENNNQADNDTPMSSRREVIGWIFYDFANSPQWQVFAALAWTLFVTKNATQYACTEYLEYGCDINDNPINTDKEVKIKLGSWELKPESFFFFVVSMSGIMQLITYILIGGLMDFNYYQYYLFRFSAITAALFNLPYIFLSDSASFMFAGWWTAVSFVIYGISNIAYNSHLVDIVENHWIIRRAINIDLDGDDISRIRKIIVDDISNFGVACGYIGSLIMTIVAGVIFVLLTDSGYTELTGYGLTNINEDNMWNEMYAKSVYGVSINYFYDISGSLDTQIASIQLFYDDIELNGTIIGDSSSTSNGDLIYQTETFQSMEKINKIYLWYNDDQTIAAIQFETTSNTQSVIFGVTESISNLEQVIVTEDDFVFGGYTVYIDNKNGNSIISGFDFVFVRNDGNQYGSTLSIRVVVLAVFIWWFGWQLITIFTMKKRKKPQIPSHSNIFTISAKNTWHVLTETFKKYKHVRYAMIAWFFYSDAIATATNGAILFALIELQFTGVELTILVLEFEIFSAVGGVFHVWFKRKLNWDARKMMIYHLVSYSIIIIYPVIGLIPNIPFGLVSKWEMWPFVFLFSMHNGSIFGYSRSLLTNLIPIGKENEMFSLYAVTDKGSSWIGSLIMGLLSNVAGLRWPLCYVFVFFSISIPIVYAINVEEGMEQCGRLHKDASNINKIKDSSEPVPIEETVELGSDSELAETDDNLGTELQKYIQ